MIDVIQKHTPNFTPGTAPRAVVGVCIHIAEGSEAGVDSHFAADASDVSSHFLVGLDGELRQYVGVHDVAYTQGRVLRPTWKGLRPGNPNAYLVGLEHEGSGQSPWPDAQLMTSTLVTAWVFQRFKLEPLALNLPLHYEIFAGKTCPGPFFDRDDYLERVRWWLRYTTPRTLLRGIR